MANNAIFELTQETVLTAADRYVLQQTSAATRATSATFALMGGLEISNEMITTTDVTGAVGKLYVCTIAGLTADRNLTLPSAQVGERVGVYVVDGDATYELILKGAASQTINGGSAATEWSRVFIANEMVVFRCTAANTWIVEYDGRIASLVVAEDSTGQTFTTGAYEAIEANNEIIDNSDSWNNSTYRFTARRAMNVTANGFVRFPNLDLGEYCALKCVLDPDGTPSDIHFMDFVTSPAEDKTLYGAGHIRFVLAAGDVVSMEATHNEGANQTASTTASIRNRVEFEEII